MPTSSNYGTGRRKTATARVFLRKGSGNIRINDRTLDEFFGRKTARMIVRQALVVAEAEGRFDVHVTVRGGGTTGQAGAIRHGKRPPRLMPMKKKPLEPIPAEF